MRGPNFQVAVVYNLESELLKGNPNEFIALKYTENVSESLYEALLSLGYHTIRIAVKNSLEELQQNLSDLSPENTFIFNNCDGFIGENIGSVKVVQLIEDMGFKHTGSTAGVIELCTNKAKAKERMMKCGVPTPSFQVFNEPGGDLRLNFPVIVKPLLEDASLGIELKSVVSCEADLWERVRYVIEDYDQPAIVEEFIGGRELAVAMWGNHQIETLPISEDDYSEIADPLQCLLTFEAKWVAESPYYQNIKARCPALLSYESERCIESVAIDTFRAMGLRDFGRVDIRYQNNIPYVIDVNEIPDLSIESGFYRSATAAGYSYADMVDRILKLSLEREGWQ
ncbi:MAG: D-alanine--D-alanine ligase family protein [Omnitrophica WOR_2 bacterium]